MSHNRIIRLIAAASVVASLGAGCTSSPTTGRTYTVKSGDSFYRIGNKTGFTPQAVANANGMQLSSLILPGDVIRLPAGSSSSASPSAPKPPSTSKTEG